MSETNTPAKPALATPETVTDSLGRTLTIKRLDALAELDLIEAAGAVNSENRRWLVMATLAACVTDIDGRPVPFPRKLEQLRLQVKTVGSEGLAAVMQALAPAEQEAAGEAVDGLAVAKNSAAAP